MFAPESGLNESDPQFRDLVVSITPVPVDADSHRDTDSGDAVPIGGVAVPAGDE